LASRQSAASRIIPCVFSTPFFFSPRSSAFSPPSSLGDCLRLCQIHVLEPFPPAPIKWSTPVSMRLCDRVLCAKKLLICRFFESVGLFGAPSLILYFFFSDLRSDSIRPSTRLLLQPNTSLEIYAPFKLFFIVPHLLRVCSAQNYTCLPLFLRLHFENFRNMA